MGLCDGLGRLAPDRGHGNTDKCVRWRRWGGLPSDIAAAHGWRAVIHAAGSDGSCRLACWLQLMWSFVAHTSAGYGMREMATVPS
jgi:hypothetical protein